MNLFETAGAYEKRLLKAPKLEFNRKHVLEFTPFLSYNVDVNRALEEVNALLTILPMQKYQLLIVNTQSDSVELSRTINPKKNRIIEAVERDLNRRVNFRELRFYLAFDSELDTVKTQLSTVFSEVKDGRENLNRQLAKLFGGIPEEPLYYPLVATDYGFKVAGKEKNAYAGVLFEGMTPPAVTQFGVSNELASLGEDFLYVLSFYRPKATEYERLLDRLRNQYSQREEESSKEVAFEISRVLTDIANEKELLYFYSSVLAVFKNSEEESLQVIKELESRFRKLPVVMVREKGSSLAVFKAVFSFERSDVEFLSWFKLIRRMTHTAFSYHFPVLKHWTGMKSREGGVYLNSCGEPVYITQHSPTTHKLTFGKTGSGKSFDLIYQSLFDDITVIIEYIEKDTGSYKPFTLLTEGEDAYFPISLDRPVSVNPFGKSVDKIGAPDFLSQLQIDYRLFDEPDLVFLEEVLSLFLVEGEKSARIERKKLEEVFERYKAGAFVKKLILGKKWDEVVVPVSVDREKLSFSSTILQTIVAGEKGDITPLLSSYVGMVVAEVYSKHDGKRELLLSDFYRVFKERGDSGDEVAKEIATRLFKFTKEGEYGSFFDYPSSFKREYLTMYFELRTLKKDLLNPVILSILKHVLDFLSHPRYTGTKRRVILDEGWTVFKNEYLQDFLEGALRTFRKKGIAIDFASQSPADATRFLVEQSGIRYFKFTDNFGALDNYHTLTEDDKEAIKSLKRPADYGYKYSATFVEVQGTGKGHAFLVVPAFFYWIATTNDQDKLRRLEAYNRYGDWWTAVQKLAQGEA